MGDACDRNYRHPIASLAVLWQAPPIKTFTITVKDDCSWYGRSIKVCYPRKNPRHNAGGQPWRLVISEAARYSLELVKS